MGKGHGSPRVFTAQFKAAAVQRGREAMLEGETQSSVARALGITPSLLSRWTQDAAVAPPAPDGETPEQELRRLRREVETLRMERDFAKKAAAYFARDVK